MDDAWHHLALTYDGNKLVFYYDGQKTESLITTNCVDETQINSVIFNARETYEGVLDDALIFNRALKPERIMNRYENTKTRTR
ncbi:MAG: hypothetical protein HRU09_10465 [Oligoflexales bacterium]|nr:hypothetical protein [Oligoflexales bacterium]